MNRDPDMKRSEAGGSVSIIVPTLREAANIPALVDRVRTALSEPGITRELILVDDHSNDCVEETAARPARSLPVIAGPRQTHPAGSPALPPMASPATLSTPAGTVAALHPGAPSSARDSCARS